MENQFHIMNELANQWPKGTTSLLADRINSLTSGKDHIDWAVNALIEGFEAPSLTILAGLDLGGMVSSFEAEDYFDKSVQELELILPDDETILRLYFSEVVHQIAAGKIDPKQGIDKIHRRVIDPLSHPTDLMAWCYLWEGNSPEGHLVEYSDEEYSETIIAYAQTWIGYINGEKLA
ncbi:MAG: hypothetical protein IAE79_17880 [Anaerolinea sp.]|nr:hypothetical protein [Anaerolinea sp.]